MQKDSLKKNFYTAALSIGLLYSCTPTLEAYQVLTDTQIVQLSLEQREQLAIKLLNDFLNTKNTDAGLQWDNAISYLIKLLEHHPRYSNLCNTLRQIQLKKGGWKITDKLKNAYTIGTELKKHKCELPTVVQKTLDSKTINELVKIIAYRL